LRAYGRGPESDPLKRFFFCPSLEVMMRRNLCSLMAGGLLVFVLQPALAVAADPQPAAIAAKMAGVTDELNRNDTGKPVQTEQKAIVDDLDTLIASLEKMYDNNNGNLKSNRPRRGMDDSRISRGTGGVGTLVEPNDEGKDWGKLSARERDRIIQSMSEGFPPEYRTVLERYYRRLADEKGAPVAGAAAEKKEGAASKDTAGK
jgi:hypothetical protein